MACQYEIIKETAQNEDIGEYETYGIKCLSHDGSIKIISDISTDKKFVFNLVNKFNELDLDIIHFMDAVLDAIN